MNFDELQVEESKTKAKKIVLAQEVARLEPGNKIPVANYQQIGQWCDTCEDVQAHVYSKDTKKIRCLRCKTTKQLK